MLVLKELIRIETVEKQMKKDFSHVTNWFRDARWESYTLAEVYSVDGLYWVGEIWLTREEALDCVCYGTTHRESRDIADYVPEEFEEI